MEKVWTHTHALAVDKSVWCQVCICEQRARETFNRACCLLTVCEVCRDSTWAQHIQAFC